jgi:hypothetical protein
MLAAIGTVELRKPSLRRGETTGFASSPRELTVPSLSDVAETRLCYLSPTESRVSAVAETQLLFPYLLWLGRGS